MKRVVKWIGFALGGLVCLLIVAATFLYWKGGARVYRQWDIAAESITVTSDSASIARGRHLAEAVTLCQGCHGENLAGDMLIDEVPIAQLYASNLTRGAGGVGSTYTDQDFVRAIRHGVNSARRGMMIMHSDVYNALAESDLASLIAYIRSVPPVDTSHPATRGLWLGRILVGAGLFDGGPTPFLPVEVIDHSVPISQGPVPAPTAEYGGYLTKVAMCTMCHSSDFTGGPPIEEGAPPATNVAMYPASYTADQFISTMRTGVTPYGRTLNGEYMPWKMYGRMTDDELMAIWEYVRGLGG